MKKLVLVVASLLLIISASHAQSLQEKKVKTEIKSLSNTHDVKVKQEKKNLRHELRTLQGNDVSESSKSEFHKDFGTFPDEKWARTANYDKVNYTQDGTLTTAYYEGNSDVQKNSNLVGIFADKHFADLPKNAQETINSKYKNYSKDKVLQFHDNVNNDMEMVMYGHELKDADEYFMELSKDGKNLVLTISKSGNVNYFSNMR